MICPIMKRSYRMRMAVVSASIFRVYSLHKQYRVGTVKERFETAFSKCETGGRYHEAKQEE